MSILDDIRAAMRTYVATNVVVTVENLRADVPNAVSPGEGFTFDVKWRNTGSVPLTNVRIQLNGWSPLILEAPPVGAYFGLEADPAFRLAPGSLHSSMVLFPPERYRQELGPNGFNSWLGLRGKAMVLGTGNVYANVVADISVETFFPKNGASPTKSLVIDVV